MFSEKLTPKELYSLVEKEFHDHNKLWGEMSKAYANSSLKLFDDTIKFVYRALATIGLVLGFGFAGIQGVQNIQRFFAGELIMFSSMMFGFYKIKTIYTKNTEAVESMSRKIRLVNEKKAIALGEMMKELRTEGKISQTINIQKYEEANKEILDLFRIGKRPRREKDESGFITVMIILFMIGFILLLMSFIPLA